ncbi:hypothetical protein M433DRAFT_469829 [Acidomyces richmondensis BFW]|nr:MAG: hypothetical protein FE78DRAFT_276960 [Acidomyces sp. 'richmondensis']KYG41530.1 hypothetical protein M433DRAFT_469829 [Acidomyces richmondensis BFW]
MHGRSGWDTFLRLGRWVDRRVSSPEPCSIWSGRTTFYRTIISRGHMLFLLLRSTSPCLQLMHATALVFSLSRLSFPFIYRI